MNKDVPEEQAKREREKHKKNFANAGGETYLDACVQSRSASWVRCALNSERLSALQACDSQE